MLCCRLCFGQVQERVLRGYVVSGKVYECAMVDPMF